MAQQSPYATSEAPRDLITAEIEARGPVVPAAAGVRDTVT